MELNEKTIAALGKHQEETRRASVGAETRVVIGSLVELALTDGKCSGGTFRKEESWAPDAGKFQLAAWWQLFLEHSWKGAPGGKSFS
jgi:hypothetical protein